VPRKVRIKPRRRKPRFALVVCASLTLAVALNVAMRNDPGHRQADATVVEARSGGDRTSAVLDAPAVDRELVEAIQRELGAKGYEPGSADGAPTLQTRAAVLAFETDIGRPLTGMPSEAILKELLFGATIVAKGLGAPKVTGEGTRLVREIEVLLAKAGFDPGAVDGKLDASTAKAIKRFEAVSGLPPTGRIGGKLASRLAALAS
jgi:peptidoglycan hydrolase-like protein with peptidoglycan-binding domain